MDFKFDLYARNSEKSILVASHGTTHIDAVDKAIKPCEDTIARKFPGYNINRVFTSDLIIRLLGEKKNIKALSFEGALKKLINKGIKEVAVQPLHIIPGGDYHDLVRSLNKFKDSFEAINFGEALLFKEKDYFQVAEILKKEVPAFLDDEIVIFMGHGTSHPANSSYVLLDYVFKDLGMENFYIANLEAYPGLKIVLDKIKRFEVNKIYLVPFMLVAGTHAKRDLAGEENSWKNILIDEGYQVEVIMKGLGEYQGIQSMFADKIIV